MSIYGLQAEHARQIPVQQCHSHGLQSPHWSTAQPAPVNKPRMIGQCRGIALQSRVLWAQLQVDRVFRRSLGQWNNSRKRTGRAVVGVRGHHHHRAGRALFMALYGIQAAPINLAPFDYHFSSSKSLALPWAHNAMSAFWLAVSIGFAADHSNASLTSDRNIFSSSTQILQFLCACRDQRIGFHSSSLPAWKQKLKLLFYESLYWEG